MTPRDFIADEVIDRVWILLLDGVQKPVVGTHRLTMKKLPCECH